MSTTCNQEFWIGTYVPSSGGGGGGTTPIYRSLTCITTDAFLVDCSTSLKVNGVPVNLAEYAQYQTLLQNQTATEVPTVTTVTGDGIRTPALTAGIVGAPTINSTSPGGLISSNAVLITGTVNTGDVVLNNTDAASSNVVISQFMEPLLTSGNAVGILLGSSATTGNAGILLTSYDISTGSILTEGIYRGSLNRSSVTPRIDHKYTASTASLVTDVVPRFSLKSNFLIPRRSWPSGAVQLGTASTQYVRFTLSPVTDMKRIVFLFQNIKKTKATGATCPCIRISSTTTAVTTPANYIGSTIGNQGAGTTNWNDGGTNGAIMLWNIQDFSTTAADQSFSGVVELTRQAPRGGSITEDWWSVSGSVVSSVNPTSSRPYFSMLTGQVFISGADVTNIFLTSFGNTPGNYVASQGWVNVLWY